MQNTKHKQLIQIQEEKKLLCFTTYFYIQLLANFTVSLYNCKATDVICVFLYITTQMKYPEITYDLPINPILNEWIDIIPEKYSRNQGLMDCIMRFADRIYDGPDGVGKGVNPFYKLIEVLNSDKLYYSSLQTLKNYYHVDLIDHLTKGNLAEYYIGYPCRDAVQLKSALGQRKNKTTSDTLVQILSSML